MDGEGKNIQVAVYDGDTLKLKRIFPFRSDTGQIECSGIAVDPDSRTVYMTSWVDDESSRHLYMYDLDTGDYRGKLKMQPSPKWLQGIAYLDGSLYVTSDDAMRMRMHRTICTGWIYPKTGKPGWSLWKKHLMMS